MKNHIYIGSLKQLLVYEGANILCTECGMISHTQINCHNNKIVHQFPLLEKTVDTTPKEQPQQIEVVNEDWKVATFKKRTKNNPKQITTAQGGRPKQQ